MLAALIFDFDGVIVDTEPLHYRAFQQVLEPVGLGYSWEEYHDRYIGYDDRDAFRERFRSAGRPLDDGELAGLIEAKAKAFLRLAEDVEPYPGVMELVREAATLMPIAICSGALPSDIEPILEQFSLRGCFSVMVTAADVSSSKPDPESYALAVTRLASLFPARNISPSTCLAIEDTPAGIASATGAGVSVLAVTNSYAPECLTGACRVVASLAELDLKTLNHLF